MNAESESHPLPAAASGLGAALDAAVRVTARLVHALGRGTRAGRLAPFIAAGSLAAAFATPAAADRHVDCAAGDTLQAAIGSAAAGEVIFVSAGTCKENIAIDRDVLIFGAGLDVVTLEAAKPDRNVVTVAAGVSANIAGVTIRGGHIGIFSNGELGVAYSEVRDNAAAGIAVYGGTFAADSIAVSHNAGSGIGIVGATRAEIYRSAILHNHVDHNGGGGLIVAGSRVSLRNVLIRDNDSKQDGGGIHALLGSEILLDDVTLRNNTSWQGHGGGIALRDSRLTATRSAISFNLADAGNGGGVAMLGKSSAALTNTTLHNNIASFWFVDRPGGAGGGLHIEAPSDATLLHATVHDNWARQASGIAAEGSASIEATLLAANFGGECGGSGSVTSRGWNLLQYPAACPLVAASSDLLGVAVATGRYGAHGEPTDSVALQRTSPAVDRIPPEACRLKNDQRDAPRPSSASGDAKWCDVGAFELQPGDSVP